MTLEPNYQPRSTYRGYQIKTATGIGGYYARTSMTIDNATTELIEVGPNNTEQGALQLMRRTIQDAMFAHGMADEPAPYIPQ